MKHTIEGFNQEYALSLRQEIFDERGRPRMIKLDCTDLVILRWFVDFFPKMVKIEVEGVQYAWVSYKDLLEDVPLLDIGKQMLSFRLKKMVCFEILTHKNIKQGGNFSYYGFGKNYRYLIEKINDLSEKINNLSEKINEPSLINSRTFVNKFTNLSEKINEQINYSIKDTSTSNSSTNNTEAVTQDCIYRERGQTSHFVPPSLEDVRAYVAERGGVIDAERFYDFYECKGWKVGREKMKDWKAAVRTWERREKSEAQLRNTQPRDPFLDFLDEEMQKGKGDGA